MNLFTKLFFISSLPFTQSLATIDTGSGADGVCNWNANQAAATYNCTSLNVTGTVGFTGAGATPVLIKVQGDVSINGTLTVNGQSNGTRGPGGFAGGTTNGAVGLAPGASASAGGSGGTKGGDFIVDYVGGGGGQGGGHAQNGSNGQDGTDPTPGGGDSPGTGGSNASVTYGNELNFTTTFEGGAGGGAGHEGGGPDGNVSAGSSGAGGGGAIRISVGGTVSITGQVLANGGNATNASYGGDDFGAGGAGGGGAGGAIFIESIGSIDITGSLSASGGTGGIGGNSAAANSDGSGGNGGNGGNGRIRLDSDGLITGAENVSPTPVVFASATSPLVLTSDISPGCAVRENHNHKPILVLTFIFLLLNFGLFLKKIKKTHARS